jgi:pentatricopeptide repeat protein
MREKGMKLELITYNAAITALAKSARQNARDTDRLPTGARNVSGGSSEHVDAAAPNDSNGKMEEDLWIKVMDLLQQMKDDGIEPDGFSYSAAINCCGAHGRWQEACDLIETMKRGGSRTRPNQVAYTAAIGKFESLTRASHSSNTKFHILIFYWYCHLHSGACGRAGESGKALELFQNMKDEGLSPDLVAYNALFSALRKAQEAEKVSRGFCNYSSCLNGWKNQKCVCLTMRGISWWFQCQSYDLWGEICGTRSTTTRASISPDIITVTDCIASLSRNGMTEEMDEVFRQAVDRGIVLRRNSLDGQWEVDLSGMAFPVARAACRYLLKKVQLDKSTEDVQDMVFITGVGMAQLRRKDNAATRTDSTMSVLEKDPTTSLRDYVQGILRSDFGPSLESTIPERAKGTVMVGKEMLTRWRDEQNMTIWEVVLPGAIAGYKKAVLQGPDEEIASLRVISEKQGP